MIIETTTITRGVDLTLVEDNENEMLIAVETELVNDLERKTGLSEEASSVLLATVEKVRILSSTLTAIEKRIRDCDLRDTLAILAGKFEIQTLCDILESLKYCEIRAIVKSDSPIEALEKVF